MPIIRANLIKSIDIPKINELAYLVFIQDY